MKKTLLVMLFLASGLFLSAQQIPRDKVVVEIATGTWCTYCPGAAMGADDLVNNGHQVAIIENHNGDVFANAYSNARNSYYGVTGYPTAKFDGVLSYVGGSHTQSMYNNYLPKYNQRIVIPSSFALSMNGGHTGLNYNVTVTAEKVAAYSGTNLKLHFVMTESHIVYSWQGMSEVNFVNRLMVPDQNGTALSFSSGSTQTVNLNFSLNSSWSTTHGEFVAFIQDNSSKEILQGIKVAINNLVPPASVDAALIDLHNVPLSSCSGEITPGVVLKNAGSIILTTANIRYSVNSGPLQTYAWSGSLGFMQTAAVSLPTSSFTVGSGNTITAYVSEPNNQNDSNHANDTLSTTFTDADEVMSVVYMELKTDNNPAEITWDLKNSSGVVLYSGGPYAQPNTVIQQTLALSDEGCYRFSIYDAAGNGICCNNGSGYIKLKQYNQQQFFTGGEYTFSEIIEFTVSGIQVEPMAMFEGPYSSNMNMYSFLNLYGYLPLSQPYSGAPWYYPGTESVLSIPNSNVVDWVLIELRESTGGPGTAGSGTIIARKAGFILKDGRIVDLDGSTPISFNNDITSNLYLVVRHRNHLGVISNYPLTPVGRIYQYNFMNGVDKAYGGTNGQKNIATGLYAMFSGDGDSNGQISNTDRALVWAPQVGQSGYLNGDFNMNGSVDNMDKMNFWRPNGGRGSQIPM